MLRTHASDCANTPTLLGARPRHLRQKKKPASKRFGVSGFRSLYLVLAKDARFRLRQYPDAARRASRTARLGRQVPRCQKINSVTGNRTPGICVTGRDVTNYTMTDGRASSEDRTRDLALTKRMLCQLSYRGVARTGCVRALRRVAPLPCTLGHSKVGRPRKSAASIVQG